MFKKFMLAVASMAVIAVAYAIYQWQGEPVQVARQRETIPLPPRVPSPTTTQAGDGRRPAIPFGPNWITGGDAPLLRVYDKKGNTRIVFRATRWDPISDSEFDLFEPTVRLTLPGGQLAYIWADEGRVTILQGEDNNPVAKRGRLSGNVRLFVDLTDETWREKHPDRAGFEQHPESVVKLWLDHVRFDLDLSFLDSDGPILLQSAPGDLEGKGLRIAWSELDRQIQHLTIEQGRRAILRNADLPGVSGSRSREDKSATAPAAEASVKPAASAPAVAVAQPRVSRIVQATQPGQLPYIELNGPADRPLEPRVETYRLSFRDRVSAVQKENGRVVGDLANADVLELLFDFNQTDRRTLGKPATQVAEEKTSTAPASAPALAQTSGGSVIELAWSGPLDVVPAPPDAGAASPANRAHLLIRGSAVTFQSRDSGGGSFPELEYHDETQRIWLRGTKEKPVTLEPSERRQLVAYGIVSADLKQRTARVDGPGRLIEHGLGEPESAPAESERLAFGDSRNVEIAWGDSVDLEFAKREAAATTAPATAPATVKVSPIPEGSYLKHAVFAGGATFSDDRGSIRADHMEVVFSEPRKPENSGDPASNMVVEHMSATGHVVMTVHNEEVTETVKCDRMEVGFGLDETGKPVPQFARAIGHAVARQTGRAAKWGPRSVHDVVLREITANDELILNMTSVAIALTPEEIARKEANARAMAKAKGIAEGSPEWKKNEERLRSSPRIRTRTVATRLRAAGRVTVLDLRQELDLAADSIDCELGRGREEIRTALIVGHRDRPATVELGDFFIRGERIDVDVVTQSAEVPGEGTMRFMTRQDLDGRAVDKAIPMVVSWDKRMSLEGDRNTGRIVGKVRAVSETVTLDCQDEMLLEFEDIIRPSAATRPAEQGRWIFGMAADLLNPPAKQRADIGSSRRPLRKRLASLEAIGNARVEASARQEGTGRETIIDQWLKTYNETLASMLPADATRSAATPSRFASRVYVKGPKVEIRLTDKEMKVDGSGVLLIEDYQLRRPRPGRQNTGAGGALLDGSSLASIESLGPSQTVFTWVDSMSFLNGSNTATFDSGVEMRHLSGAKLIELERVASAIRVDPERLRQYPGREASLNCDHFTVEFERDAKTQTGQPAPLSRATRLKGFKAAGRQVRLEESGRFVEGTEISFDSATQIGRVIGSPEFPARMRYLDERTGRPAWSQVDEFRWDQRKGVITSLGTRVIATGK